MTKAYLEISLNIAVENRVTAAGIYTKYKQPFLDKIQGASSKELLIREEDVQVLHGFDTVENANAYLKTELFNNDVVKELAPLLIANPDIKVYFVA
jgi:hypothetical protein